MAKQFPEWLRKRLPAAERVEPVLALLRELHLGTVCQAARCPNMGECFARGTATFMILGRLCTRECTFCAIRGGTPEPVDPGEPERVAEAAKRLGLRHVVVTSVTRDDLPDGGSAQFAETVRAIHRETDAAVEVLTPDFEGCAADLDRVLDAGPEVFNHNVETVPRLYPEVRPQADYARSLGVVARAARSGSGARRGRTAVAKSGLMLGLGEREDEVLAVLADLRGAGCRVVTLGQYLAPSPEHHPVVEFVPPEQFERLAGETRRMGFEVVASGPFVRSSYHAEEVAGEVLRGGTGELKKE